ncbi:MAG TPA: sodium:solute symporter, partial [Epsilonproteobacteria bacterium]|nr:sodium:solute symporter [Campylobacterota bacterium]
MQDSLEIVDWAIVAAYFLLLALTSIILSQNKIKSSRDYFTAGNKIPFFAAAISILATSQSAATFLGAPEYAYRHNLSFIGFYFSALLGIYFVAYWLIPRFYAIKAVTVYEFLGDKYGVKAQRYTGLMFLLGQLLSSGVRLYIAALAISMILFLDIAPLHVGFSILVLIIGALAYTYVGGVRSIIFSDMIQAFVYIGAAFAVFWHLYNALNSDFNSIVQTLASEDKLSLVTTSGDYSIFALLSGWLLLNIAAYGLNQDMTQRALTCADTNQAKKSLFASIILTIPVAFLFLIIGLLLYLYY